MENLRDYEIVIENDDGVLVRDGLKHATFKTSGLNLTGVNADTLDNKDSTYFNLWISGANVIYPRKSTQYISGAGILSSSISGTNIYSSGKITAVGVLSGAGITTGNISGTKVYSTGMIISTGVISGAGVMAGNISGSNLILSAGDIKPVTNSTTALNIAQADGTNFVVFDTTNKRMGIGRTPTTDLDVYKEENAGNIPQTMVQGVVFDSYYSGLTGTGKLGTIDGSGYVGGVYGSLSDGSYGYIGYNDGPSYGMYAYGGSYGIYGSDSSGSYGYLGNGDYVAGVYGNGAYGVYGEGSDYGVYGVGTTGVYSDGELYVNGNVQITQGKVIKPSGNSTTAIRLSRADGTSNVVVFDTTNSRIGVGYGITAPVTTLHVKGQQLNDGATTLSGEVIIKDTTKISGATIISNDLTSNYIKTGENEFLAHDIIRHTLTLGESAAGEFNENWSKATTKKVVWLSSVVVDESSTGDIVTAGSDMTGDTIYTRLSGSMITCYKDTFTPWDTDDIVTIYIVYEK